MLTVAFLIMKNFLFISGLLVFCLGCIAIDKNYLGLGVFLVGFSTWFFINSLLHYLAKFEKITDHERRINSLKLKSKEINWVEVEKLKPHFGNHLLLFDGQFICYGYYSAITDSFHTYDYKEHDKIIKWANIPNPILKDSCS
ncbi:MAG: hypothetical protein BWY33_01858 [Candidatus Dependentiae bacterium ADurb.Bin246]|nr:MAG: hypothetical protein BWY33_01858 [Candidatus Dependentiae bacterium ADurb.Bin246]